ncbi:hypothetical protein Q5P01_020093 [Channa striata]|uniref:Uncharacterized protein n=1 Tax=Channa striata TaxID=64152 RepID=A0AA88S2V9_CHASR|nr:hypothetical protein Q5P01_020093 [Channa striata]
MQGAWESDAAELRDVNAAQWKQARARELAEEEKAIRRVMGVETIAWEKADPGEKEEGRRPPTASKHKEKQQKCPVRCPH